MRFRLLLLSLLFVATLMPGYAQQGAKQDFLITEAGDTLRGKLQIPRFVSETGVQLTSTGGAADRIYLPAQSRGFGTADGRRFVRRRMSFGAERMTVRNALARSSAQDSVPVFMQVLVLGKVQLYQVEYHLVAERSSLEYTKFEDTFLYLRLPGNSFLRLSEPTFRGVLRTLLQDCEAVQAEIRKAKFTASELASLLLAYNQACGAGFGPAVSLPLAAPSPPPTGVRFGNIGLRAGATLGKAYYPGSAYNTGKAQLNGTLGLSFQTLGQGPWGVMSGLYVTARRNESRVTETVAAGFTNAGDQIIYNQKLSVWALQVPLLVQYTVTPATNGLAANQLFLALGPVIGSNFQNKTLQDEPINIFVPGQFTMFKRGNKMVDINENSNPSFTQLTVGGQASIGVRRRKVAGGPTLVGELYYERGRELKVNFYNGSMHYQNAGLRVGLDF